MSKTFKPYAAIWALLYALFNVISFVSFGATNVEKYTPNFWIGYVFITIAFFTQLVCASIAFNAKNKEKFFINVSLISISWTGLILSFVFGGLCMLVSALQYWIAIIVCAFVLTLNIIALVKASIAADLVSKVDDKLKVQTFFIKALTAEANTLLARAQTDEIKAECKKLYEVVRYSDPMSNLALTSTESEITIKFAELKDAVIASDIEAVKALASAVTILIEDRNNRCKLLK